MKAFSYADPFASLRNQRWLITGGASGIGEEVVKAAFELIGESGEIHIADLNEDGLKRVKSECADSDRIHLHVLDVSDQAACAALIEKIEALGPIDLFVPSAGVVRPDEAGQLSSHGDMKFMLDVNFWGTFNLLAPLLPKMMERRSGRVSIVGSVVAQVGLMGRSGYVISKHAIAGLTKSAAEIAGPYGVRVNEIDPGRVMSPLVVGWLGKAPDAPKAFQQGCATQSTGTMPFPAQIARLIIMTLSDQCEVLNGSFVDASSNWRNGHFPFAETDMPEGFPDFRTRVETEFDLSLTPASTST